MNGYNFTEHVRHGLAAAREEAVKLNHEYVGTEHVLLGLLRTDGVGTTVIQNCNADLDELRAYIIAHVKPGTGRTVGPDLPYTSRAKKCLEFAMSEARQFNHSYVGTEHLVLGLLREAQGIGGQSLVAAGVTLEKARTEVLRILATGSGRLGERMEEKDASSFSVRPEFWRSLPEPFGSVMADAHTIARKRGDKNATIADMLEAMILFSPAVSTAFTSREIEIDALIADVRSNE